MVASGQAQTGACLRLKVAGRFLRCRNPAKLPHWLTSALFLNSSTEFPVDLFRDLFQILLSINVIGLL